MAQDHRCHEPVALGRFRVDSGFYAGSIARGEVYLAYVEMDLAGTLRLDPHDPYTWPDDSPGEALNLHNLAVRRTHAGRGLDRQLWPGPSCTPRKPESPTSAWTAFGTTPSSARTTSPLASSPVAWSTLTTPMGPTAFTGSKSWC